MGCQRVGAGSGLQGELVWSRGDVKHSGPLSGERFGHKAAKHVACCYAPHAAVWLAQCCEACHCERRGDVCGDTCLRQLRGRFGKKLDGIDVLQQELQMLRPHAGKAGRSLRWTGWAGWCESSSGETSVRGTGGRRVAVGQCGPSSLIAWRELCCGQHLARSRNFAPLNFSACLASLAFANLVGR